MENSQYQQLAKARIVLIGLTVWIYGFNSLFQAHGFVRGVCVWSIISEERGRFAEMQRKSLDGEEDDGGGVEEDLYRSEWANKRGRRWGEFNGP